MRLFVAVYPAPEAVTDLSRLVDRLALGRPREPGRSVRLVPPERWHLTLAFLDEVPQERQPAVSQALADAAAQWRIENLSAPTLRLGGGGRFGRGRFTTVWVGVSGDTEALARLAERVRRALRTARVPFDRKALRPHLTLARPGDRLSAEDLAADLAALTEYSGPQWTATELRLMRSEQGPRPSYSTLAAYPLA
jgi:2'-5' RNA ligase